mmetsp:Transcript_32394/g.89526  ORF Transcript_32394/g.89526 Transcript_32394/m.89526 type:complete len:216 (+) Transcript_32394:480-1127(+)
MKVFCTMTSSLPSFQGESAGHCGAAVRGSKSQGARNLPRCGRRFRDVAGSAVAGGILAPRPFSGRRSARGDRAGLELEDEPAADFSPMEVLSEQRSPVELERRRAPGTGVGGGKVAWMNVLCTMLLKLPSFHGDNGGHLGAGATGDSGALFAEINDMASAELGAAPGDVLNGPSIGAKGRMSFDARSTSAKSRGSTHKSLARGSASRPVLCKEPK